MSNRRALIPHDLNPPPPPPSPTGYNKLLHETAGYKNFLHENAGYKNSPAVADVDEHYILRGSSAFLINDNIYYYFVIEGSASVARDSSNVLMSGWDATHRVPLPSLLLRRRGGGGAAGGRGRRGGASWGTGGGWAAIGAIESDETNQKCEHSELVSYTQLASQRLLPPVAE